MEITQNGLLALVGAVLLGGYTLLPYADPTLRSVAVGALVGLVGGHLNGLAAGKALNGTPD